MSDPSGSGILLEYLDISERQFGRRFGQAIGLLPKFYIRMARFQEALSLMKTRRFQRLSDIAYDLNYSDQSHVIRDVKEFAGRTPKCLSQTVHDFVLNLQVGYR